jgi:GTPase-activating protein BEM2
MAIYQSNTDSSNNQHDSSTDANLRMAIFTVINEWLLDGGGLIDVLDQPELYNEISSWLHNEREHAIPPAGLRGGADHDAWREVEETRLSLTALFEGQTKRPPLRHVSAYDQGVYGTSTRSYGMSLPDPDRISAQDLIEQLDAIGAVGIRGLQAEVSPIQYPVDRILNLFQDLVSCMEILEIQSKDKTGWILLTDLPTLSQDEMIIQNIYFHLTLIEPSPLLSDFPSTPRLINLAQPSIRAMLHCFDRARKWATAVLAQPGISLDTRHRRMELFLQALDICRHLSSKTDGVPYDAPVIRSFVETVLTTAILSPESRMFHRAWYQTALHRGVNNVESLESFLHPVINEQLSFEPGFKLTVDFGWMIERLLELISMPDTLVTATETLGTVVNFEKRR